MQSTHIQEWLRQNNKKQVDLAIMIGGEKPQPKHYVRAHRLCHGAKPNDVEMPLIIAASGGELDANSFYKLPHKTGAPLQNKKSKVKKKVKNN